MPTLVPPVLCPGVFRDRPQPWLADGDVELRPWAEQDSEFVARAYSDPEIQR